MAQHEHHYQVEIEWTGNKGKDTESYRAYSRNHRIVAEGKAEISGSADPAFLGDRTRWNPEELLIASASACHKLWYLHLCAEAGIRVCRYRDRAEGTLVEGDKGRFTAITLYPEVVIRQGDDLVRASALHERAHELCFIANSLSVPVTCVPHISWQPTA